MHRENVFATSEANLIAIFIDSMLKNSLYSYRNARQPEQDSYFSGLNGGFQFKFAKHTFFCLISGNVIVEQKQISPENLK